MYFKDFNFYLLEKEKWLQDLIREKIQPVNVFQKEGYTIEDVLDYYIQNERCGTLEFLGSPSKNFCFRLSYPNSKVIEPHIIGDIKYLRTFAKQSIDFMFVKNDIEKINIYTHLPAITKVASYLGFEQEGLLTKTYLYNNELIDIYIYGLTKEKYNKGK